MTRAEQPVVKYADCACGGEWVMDGDVLVHVPPIDSDCPGCKDESYAD